MLLLLTQSAASQRAAWPDVDMTRDGTHQALLQRAIFGKRWAAVLRGLETFVAAHH